MPSQTQVLLTFLAWFVVPSLFGQVLLISDQQGFRTLASELREEGYDVTLREEEYDNNYANLLDATFLDSFAVIVYSETGFQSVGSVIPANVAAGLENYVNAGGHLLVTGNDVFAHPADGAMASLVGSTSTADYFVSLDTWVVPDIDHPVLNGPYGNFRGQTFTGINFRDFSGGYDTAEPNVAAGTIELATLGSPRGTGKLLFTDRPGPAGSVTFWNGGTADPNVDPQDELLAGTETGSIFRNYLASTDGLPAAPGGKVVITEFMMAPEGSGNSIGQYIEIFNAGPTSIDLDGWSIRKTNTTTGHTISGSVVVAPGTYALLGQTADLGGTLATGVTADYDYDDFDFLSGGSGLQLVDDQGVEVDHVNVVFGTFFPDASYNGVAHVFTGTVDDDNKEFPAWAKAIATEPGYDPGNIDLGSPGTAGSDQSAIEAVPLSYYVSFDLGDLGTLTGGDLLQTVEAGTSAEAPTFGVDPGWLFAGWNLDFSTVIGPMVVTAQYVPEIFQLTFVEGTNGTRTGGGPLTQFVSVLDPVVEPVITADPGWRFAGWDTDFSLVTSDLTITALFEAGPSAVAGGDVEIADLNDDDQVLVRLDGSASQPATGTIASWDWTWPGGSASGEVVDVIFPANDLAIPVTLTVTDGAGDTAVDTLNLTVLRRETGLFKDFAGFTGGIDDTYLAGDTLLVDGSDAASTEVFRLTAGTWVESPITPGGPDLALVDSDTIVSGDFTNLTGFTVHRWSGGAWIGTGQTIVGSLPPVDGSRKTFAFTSDTVVIGDGNNDGSATDGGRVDVFEWTADTWTHATSLQPGDGLGVGARYGDVLAVEGDLMVIAKRIELFSGSYVGRRLDVFRRAGGSWSFDESIFYDPSVPTSISRFLEDTELDLRNGTILARTTAPATFVVIEEIASTWVQTEISYSFSEFSFINGLHLDSDSTALIASGNAALRLYERDLSASDWTGFAGAGRPPLVSSFTRAGDFESGRAAIINGSSVRLLMDGSTGEDRVAVEATANAGSDIATTSFDGSPVRVFLNGGASSHPDGPDSLTATWLWDGGSATGLRTFADIPASVTSIELVLTDGRGGVAKDTINVDIIQPPLIDAGVDRSVVDVDADGSVRLNVSGSVLSQDAPVVSWTWRWTGGSFNGQSGTITLTEAAQGQPVTLEVIDANGLSRQTSFHFSLLDADPQPDIITAADGEYGDMFGAAVSIDDGVALVGAPEKEFGGTVLGASYLLEDVTGNWQQIPLPMALRQGESVLVEGDEALVGAPSDNSDGSGAPGSVEVYRKANGNWNYHASLVPVDPATGFPRTGLESDGDFGLSMDRDGDLLIVGAPTSNSNDGRAFVFELVAGEWEQVAEINPPAFATTEGSPGFGVAVAIHGDFAVVGSKVYQGNLNSGAAFVYERDAAGAWSFVTHFESDNVSDPGITPFDRFAYAVDIGETELLVGASGDDEGVKSGALYRYSLVYDAMSDTRAWSRVEKIASPANGFGSSIALEGAALAVAAWSEAAGGLRGAVYTYLLTGGTWQQSGYLPMNTSIDPGVASSSYLGLREASLDHDGNHLIVGAPEAFDSSIVRGNGRAYIYRNFAGLDPDANFEPLADAGADIPAVDTIVRGPAPDYEIIEPLGSEEVLLDGSGSSDLEDSIVSWEWNWNGGSATGETVSARFPVGTTTVTLTVTDDQGVVNSDTVDVIVSLAQVAPDPLADTTGNTLTVNLPVAGAKWRLSSEFEWHDSGHTITQGILADASYRLEMLAYPGSPEILSELILTESDGTTTLSPAIDPPSLPAENGIIGFPENAEGFGWRLVGETSLRNAVENNDGIADFSDVSLPLGTYRIEFKPVAGFATPPSRLVTVVSGTTHFTSSGYQQLASYDPAKTFEQVVPPQQLGNPNHFTGMILTRLGRGTGTVVSERVVLTAAHLFFDENGLTFEEVEWFPRQQQGEYQAEPVSPRGILYRTSYAKLVAPDTVPDEVTSLPDDDQEVDFAVLYFNTDNAWTSGEAGFLESSAQKNWLTGTEPKLAVGYPQRSQPFPQRGTLFEKDLLQPLTPLDANSPPKLYSTDELSGDGGASGSALFVQPAGAPAPYPAAVLLAGQGRAVYRVIDQDVTRMIKDGEDAASGNDEVLDSSSSLVGFGGLGGFTTLAVQITPNETLAAARWSITPDVGSGYTNVMPGDRVAFNSNWESFTVSFSDVPGYATPEPLFYLKEQVNSGATNTYSVVYEPLSSYEIWLRDNGIGSDSADDDRDSLEALVEYALDRDPGVSDYLAPIRMVQNPSQDTFAEFEVYVSAVADGIRYEVQVANDLGDFATGTNVLTLRTLTKADGTSDYLVIPDTQPISASNTRFGRVVITHDRSLSTAP
ncbi:lamin tail domain-containing protein [Haloferula sp. A504]|uniref:lamin tail domain-containing protein n=1 Tax=Haloferula sp. A504 TaxID=3373601 RepID=UPI0031C9F468|nr:lamin tail domain-containing protein [Verrucomicrobiaceae bacterium E54]